MKKVEESVGKHLFLSIALVLVVGFSILLFIKTLTQANNFKELSRKQQTEIASMLAQHIVTENNAANLPNIKTIYNKHINQAHSDIVSMALFSKERKLVEYFTANSHNNLNIANVVFSNLDLLSADKTNVFYDGHYSFSLTPLKDPNNYQAFGYLAIASSQDDITEIMHLMTFQSVVILACMLIILIVMVRDAIGKKLILPLKQVTNYIQDFSRSNELAELPGSLRNDEIAKLLQAYADMMKKIISHEERLTQANESLREEAGRVALLQESSMAANMANEIDDLLQIIVDNVCHYTHWPVGHVLLYDKKSEELYSSDIWYLLEKKRFEEFKNQTIDTRFSSGQQIPGMVLETKETVWIEDFDNYKDFARKRSANACGLKACVCLPIFIDNEIWGVIEFFTQQRRNIDNSLIDLIKNITLQVDQVIKRKMYEKELKKAKELSDFAKEAAERANMAKTEFLSNMSHELRTPLHGILSYTSLGVKKVEDGSREKLKDYLETIQKSGERLLGLLNTLLDLSKLECKSTEFHFKENNLYQTTAAVLKEMSSVINDHHLHVSLSEPSFSSTFYYNEDKIHQAVLNLLSNAINFTPDGKKIDISLYETTIRLGRRKTDKADTKAFGLCIMDEGLGIPNDELDTIFEKFVQSSNTKTGAGGTGLGLAITKEIVAAHMGKIWAKNNDKGGAVFYMELPEKPEYRKKEDAR